jgi:hypothetical protein
MTDVIQAIIITSLICVGLDISTKPKMILYFIRRWLDSIFIKTEAYQQPVNDGYVIQERETVSSIYYPILYCIRCMASVYGLLVCLVYLPFTPHLIYQIPTVILGACALNTILNSQYV